MKSKRVTIKDVARAARVHHSTVSLALRNHPSIPEHTRERIRKAVEQVGYQRDPALSALRRAGRGGARAPKIVYLSNLTPEIGFYRHGYSLHFLQGARDQASALGFELDLQFLGPDYQSSDTLSDYLDEHNVTGLLLGALLPGCIEPTLDWEEYSVLKIDSQQLQPACAVVSNDQMQITRLAYSKLVDLGYRRIGLAVGLAAEAATNHRYGSGYAISQAVLPQADRIPPLFYPYNASLNIVIEMMGQWVRRYKIDAVMSNLTMVADDLRTVGLKVPEEVACACLCMYERSDEMAGVINNLRLVGARAVAQLAEQMRAGQRGVSPFASGTYLRGFWRDGPTAPPKDGRTMPVSAPFPTESFSGPAYDALAGNSFPVSGNRLRPRMRDVAARAGVGTTTVSLALRNHPSIPLATQQRVRQAADLLGYRPDPMLDAFNHHRTEVKAAKHAQTVGFLVEGRRNWHGTDDWHCDRLVWQGLQAEAIERGIRLERLEINDKTRAERLNNILIHRGIDGLVIGPCTTRLEHLDLDWNRFSAVKIESAHLQPQIDMISSDQRHAMQTSFRRMRALGFRRIGLVTWENDERRLEQVQVAGLLVEQAMIPERDRVAPLIFTTEQIESLDVLLPQWIKANRIDAVISNWNNLPALVLTDANKAPTGFASLDLRPGESKLAGVFQNHLLVGRRALEQVSVLMRSNQCGVPVRQASTLVPGFWRDGDSARMRIQAS